MRPGTPLILASGVILMLLGAFYVVGGRYLRDRAIRRMQRESYVRALRAVGIVLILTGAGVLVALGMGWL